MVAMGFSSVTIQPEQNRPRNWTMVSPILSYRLPCVYAWAYGFSPASWPEKLIEATETSSSTLDTKVSPIP